MGASCRVRSSWFGPRSITPAIAIGRLIRARGLKVEVARVAGGKPTDVAASCASACVLVLAAGTSRVVGPAARVGVYRLVDWTTYSKTWDTCRVLRRRGVEVGRVLLSRRVLSSRDVFTDAPPQSYAAVRRYVAEMGEAPGLVALMQRTPSVGVQWMTPDELRATRIATDRIGGSAGSRGPAHAILPSFTFERSRHSWANPRTSAQGQRCRPGLSAAASG